MIETREVPRPQWRELLDQFSRRHQGRRAAVQTIGPEGGSAGVNAAEAPLLGITEECQAAGPSEIIEIMTGEAGGRPFSHTVQRPRTIQASEWNDGYSAALSITAEDGTCTRVQVGPAEESLSPGMVADGIILEGGEHRV